MQTMRLIQQIKYLQPLYEINSEGVDLPCKGIFIIIQYVIVYVCVYKILPDIYNIYN